MRKLSQVMSEFKDNEKESKKIEETKKIEEAKKSESKTKKIEEAKEDIDGVIQALVDAKPSDDNAEQGKFVSLMKGLAFSDDPKATAFMKKLMGKIDKSFVG